MLAFYQYQYYVSSRLLSPFEGQRWRRVDLSHSSNPSSKRKKKEKKRHQLLRNPKYARRFYPHFLSHSLVFPSSLTPRHLSRPFWHLSPPRKRRRIETTVHRPKIYYYSARPGMVDPQIRIRQTRSVTRAMSLRPVSPYLFPTFPLGKGKGEMQSYSATVVPDLEVKCEVESR